MAKPSSDIPLEYRPPKWPWWVGLNSTLTGALLVMYGGFPLVGDLFQPLIRLLTGHGSTSSSGPVPTWLDAVVSCCNFAIGIQLFVAGKAAFRYDPASRRSHLIYGFVGLPISIISAALAYVTGHASVTAVQSQLGGGHDLDWVTQVMELTNDALLAGLWLTFGGWAVFCLFWFGLVKTKPTDFGPLKIKRCPHCSHDLQGQSPNFCPQCGGALQ